MIRVNKENTYRFCKSWEERCESHYERDSSSPIRAPSIVCIYTVGAIHIGNREHLSMDDPIIGDENTGDWGKPDSVAGHEIDDRASRNENIPWCHCPCAENCTHELSTAD